MWVLCPRTAGIGVIEQGTHMGVPLRELLLVSWRYPSA
jgi:hypothetical protein